MLKITEDIVGGIPKATKMKRWFDLNHVFGVPTVRDPHGRMVKKKLADTTVSIFYALSGLFLY